MQSAKLSSQRTERFFGLLLIRLALLRVVLLRDLLRLSHAAAALLLVFTLLATVALLNNGLEIKPNQHLSK